MGRQIKCSFERRANIIIPSLTCFDNKFGRQRKKFAYKKSKRELTSYQNEENEENEKKKDKKQKKKIYY